MDYSGVFIDQLKFPNWLGYSSRFSKMSRILQDLHVHTRLSMCITKVNLVVDYCQSLRNHIVSPLVKKGTDGVDLAVTHMVDYSMMKEDLDGLLQVTQWNGNPDPMKDVEKGTKSSFTRKYKRMGLVMPYSIPINMRNTKNKMMVGEDREEVEEEIFDYKD